MIEIRVSGKCPSCGFVHKNTIVKFAKLGDRRSRYADCAKCNNIMPWKIEGCTCAFIGDTTCKIHNHSLT